MYAITGATGQLGRLVVDALLTRVAPQEIIAVVRNPAKASDLAALGVHVRTGDYDAPETLADAFKGVDKLLMISANEVGRRVVQHTAVIEAAKVAGVKLVAYTSVLHADTSLLDLAVEHRETEALLAASGLPYVLLRNGWYAENYIAGVPAAVEHGVLLGSAQDGKLSLAARVDYAEAAAAVLVAADDQAGKVYELAGDDAITLAGFAALVSDIYGKVVPYKDLPEAEYAAVLAGAGLPPAFAAILAQSDVAAAQGALFDGSGVMGRLIGRPTTPVKTVLLQNRV